MTDLLTLPTGTRVLFRNKRDGVTTPGTITAFLNYSQGLRRYLVDWDDMPDQLDSRPLGTGEIDEDQFTVIKPAPRAVRDHTAVTITVPGTDITLPVDTVLDLLEAVYARKFARDNWRTAAGKDLDVMARNALLENAVTTQDALADIIDALPSSAPAQHP